MADAPHANREIRPCARARAAPPNATPSPTPSAARARKMRLTTRAGVTNESIGQWMNFARRAERSGDHVHAAKYAQRALDVADKYGPHLGEGFTMAAGTREFALRIVAAGREG